jgi:DNA-3-methyladenine glycosylase
MNARREPRTSPAAGGAPPAAGDVPAGYALLAREFFDRSALEVAPEVLGCVLWHVTDEGTVAGVITEVEAYTGPTDPASHSFRGPTARNGVMFGPPGHAYVYFTYGMHYCVNLVCEPPHHSSAVLLRAARIVEGADLAGRRRLARRPAATAAGRGLAERDLARGPGTLCQALGIDLSLDGADVCAADSPLAVGTPPGWSPTPAADISAGPRVGITQAADRPWRFWLTGDPTVSAYRRAVPPPGRSGPILP